MFNFFIKIISSCPENMKPVIAFVTDPWTHKVSEHIIACVQKSS